MIPSLLLVVLLGTVPALVLTRSILVGVPLAVAVVLLTCSIGATVATLLGWSVVGCILVAALIILAASGWQAWRIGGAGWRSEHAGGQAAQELGLLALFGVPALAIFTMSPPVPLGWDARSVWWFHASWFQYGGEAVRQSITNPRFAFSHPEYPAAVPAATAAAWRLAGGGENLHLAQTLTAVLTAVAVTGLAAVLIHTRRGPVSVVSALALVMATPALAEGFAVAGYVDLLGAALLVTSLTALVSMASPRLAIGAGSLALAGASLTKNEGLVFGAAVLVIAIVATRHQRRRVALVGAAALVPAVAWQLAVRSTGVTIEADQSPAGFLNLWRAEPVRRLRVAAPRVLGETGRFIVPAVVALLLLVVVCRLVAPGRRRALATDLRPAAALVAAAIVTDVIATMVYGAGRFEIEWWLNTSLVRVSTTPKLFCLAALALMANAAARLARPSATPAPTSPDLGVKNVISGG